jgi:hypothetical protein
MDSNPSIEPHLCSLLSIVRLGFRRLNTHSALPGALQTSLFICQGDVVQFRTSTPIPISRSHLAQRDRLVPVAFCLGRNFANWRQKKRPSATSTKDVFQKTFKKLMFLKKEKEFARFRQWVRVAHLDWGRIHKIKLYCPPRTVAI